MTTCDFRFYYYVASGLLKHFKEKFYAEPCSKSVSEKTIQLAKKLSDHSFFKIKFWFIFQNSETFNDFRARIGQKLIDRDAGIVVYTRNIFWIAVVGSPMGTKLMSA
jgi:hypothetical protein